MSMFNMPARIKRNNMNETHTRSKTLKHIETRKQIF